MSDIPSNIIVNKFIFEEATKILIDYDFCAHIRLNNDSKKFYLKDSIDKRCRFCGLSYPDVSFSDNSHTLPELIGNKWLFSGYECDNCNKNYFNLFENELANFMLPFNVIYSTPNKKNKLPKYKLNGWPQIINNSNNITITDIEESDIEILDDLNAQIRIKIPSYIPEYVYRCIVKMAISIIPEQSLYKYKNSILWLMNLDFESNLTPYLLFSFYPNTIQSNEIFCTVLERKDECLSNVPSSIFFLSYKSFAFQICIPFCSNEKLHVKLNAFPFIYPTFIDLYSDYYELRANNVINLSLKERKRDDIVTFILNGERNKTIL